MKTVNVLTRKMGDFNVFQRTSDGYFEAYELVRQWNSLEGNEQRKMDVFLSSTKTKEFIDALLEDLSINSFGLQNEDKQLLTAGWTDLILGEEKVLRDGYTTRQFGLDLIVYSIHKNGFAFGNKSFLYLLSTEVKARLPKYINYLKTSANTRLTDVPGFDVNREFLNLFLRNNSDLRGLIQTIPTAQINISEGQVNEANNYLWFRTRDALPTLIKSDGFLYQNVGNGLYKFVTKLGVTGVGKEYTPDMLPVNGHTKDSIYLKNSLVRKEFSSVHTVGASAAKNTNEQPSNKELEELEFINKQSEAINKLSLKEQRLEEYKKLLTIVTTQAAINQVEENIKKYC